MGIEHLSTLYLIAWLMPLLSFVAILFFGPRMGRLGSAAGYVATGAILTGVVLSLIGLGIWIGEYTWHAPGHNDTQHHAGRAIPVTLVAGSPAGDAAHDHGHETAHETAHDAAHDHGHDHGHDAGHDAGHAKKNYVAGNWYTLAEFGGLRLNIGYYIDALTVVMFCMVTIIATCIHFYAMGYMHDELVEDYEDHEITMADGSHLHRRGRYHRFFQYFSLFCFSMLGIVISGNVAMTFVFWELVGICSYFLIGFYFERHSASTAANKAFIVNRVGDFGMIIGLMALFGALGTFEFGGNDGIFALVRTEANHYELKVPDGMVQAGASDHVASIVNEHLGQPNGLADSQAEIAAATDSWRAEGYGYALLVIAGLGIFCGCVGKSAQLPLHTWLPDAMEGPTPVSALVHSATMVAAGVFLTARFYPVFTAEVLFVIAVIGCITLFVAATIAIVATDIKRVLAYSTLSQLGYMMFALGVGGWVAGVLHLITHAFFKSLLFLCSGSVIHAVHSNEMTDMGGLLKKMPITAITMLIGCLAIAGAGVPLVVGLSGYYSKDAILAQALSFTLENESLKVMFIVAAGGAAITAFYMFRLWFMTFLGPPRDQHRYDHAHESPAVMCVPLLVLAVFAVFVATPHPATLTDNTTSPLVQMLEQAIPNGVHAGIAGSGIAIPAEHNSHAEEIHRMAGLTAFFTAAGGVLMACCIYWWRLLDPAEIRGMFEPIYRFLRNKWWFDEIYDVLFVKPTLMLGRMVAWFDRAVIDRLIDGTARFVTGFSSGFDRWIDQTFVDGLANWVARRTYSIGVALRNVQTGKIRQYVVLIVVGTVAVFLLATLGMTD